MAQTAQIGFNGGVELNLTVNDKPRSLDVEPDTPLLWVLRDTLGLTGTKFGCGVSACGACTVHVNGAPSARAAACVRGRRRGVTTIEGLWRTSGRSTRFSRHGSTCRCRSAATASRG